ncbi:flagellar protein FlgN [Oceanobacillus salinisoli]|uniref:flagellar protein FlgN n=1 Tax=Oceanobacillus salinisoli TaxID=2678611 RepID=UPI0012E1B8F2|nr:flagellar protein FlgN [Oceanobacillus salinisoli]
MSVKPIIQSLEKLITLHEELLTISERKTELVKEGSVEELQALLVKERKHIRVLEQTEANRQQEVEKWLTAKGLPTEDVTITNILQMAENEAEKEELAAATTALTDLISKLKQQESLNHGLLKQSMQFVQLSMELLNPSISSVNYGKQKEVKKSMSRSLFDSQA